MKKVALLLLIIAINVSCKKNPKKGDHIYCKVNGIEWSGGGNKELFARNKDAKLSQDGKTLTVYGSQGTDVSDVYFFLTDTVKPLTSGFYELTSGGYSRNYITYDTDSLNKGYIILSIEENGNRVSGSFSFDARSKKTADIVHVTEGSFNLRSR